MLILASASATRKALLHNAGLQFEVRRPEVDERRLEAELVAGSAGPEEIALGLAAAKAESVSTAYPEALVIGADQVLALGDRLLHKPAGLAAAREQLEALRGRTHSLHSSVAIARGGGVLWRHTTRADLTMRPFSTRERDLVLELEGEDVLNAVGSYRLEGPSIRLFEMISGDYFTILGLPMLPLLAAVRAHAPALLDQSA